MQVINKIRSNFSSLPEVLLFIRIFLLATVLPLLVKLLAIPRLMKVLTPQSTKLAMYGNSDDIKDRIEKYTLYLLSRDFWMYKNICLKRALILYHFLRKYGLNVTVCFGVRYKNERSGSENNKIMEGHAWLLYKGEIFLEANAEETKTYKVTYCYPEIKDDEKENEFITDIEELM